MSVRCFVALTQCFGARCGGAVFEAEKVTVKNDVYHKRCFNCRRCARAMDSLLVSVAPDGEVYCKVTDTVVTTLIGDAKIQKSIFSKTN